MDKSWMDKARNTQSYIEGVEKFIEFSFTHSARGNSILCPCRKCLNCCWSEASEGALLQKKVLQERNATLSEKKKAAIQQDKDVALHHNKMSTSIRKEVAITQKNHQQGKDVILYSVYRDHGSPVAKATILSIDRREEVGGQELGSEYCKVVVNYVIKRDAILPCGIGNMRTMGQAQGRCIAWPYKHLEVDKSIAKAAMRPQASRGGFPKVHNMLRFGRSSSCWRFGRLTIKLVEW